MQPDLRAARQRPDPAEEASGSGVTVATVRHAPPLRRSMRAATAAARARGAGPRALSGCRCARSARTEAGSRRKQVSTFRRASSARSGSARGSARRGRGSGSACRRGRCGRRRRRPRRCSALATQVRRRASGRADCSGSRTRSARSARAGSCALTSATSLLIVAIVIVVQFVQPPWNGVSRFGSSGYGLCAYDVEPRVRRTHAGQPRHGETPPVEPRGAVPPPATCAPAIARWIAGYAGLSRRVV